MATAHRPHYLEFVARLRRARKNAGVTQRTLADRLGKPQSYISKIETCERRLDVIEAAEWCVAVGVALGDVLPSALRPFKESSTKTKRRSRRD